MTTPPPPQPPQPPQPADQGTELDALDGLASDAVSRPAPAGLRGNAVRAAQMLIGFICVALICLNVWLVSVAHEHEMAQITLANDNLAHSVAQQVDSAISDVDHVLDDIVFELERSDLSTQALERLQPTLVNKAAKVDQLKGLFVYDADGRWLVTSEAVSNEGRNNADREYFRYHRDNPSLAARLGAPVVSRSSGEWIIPLSRRLTDARGQFAGVALATLQLKYFQEILARFHVGQEGAMALILTDRLLLRAPNIESDIGRQVSASPLIQMAARQASGSLEERSPFDHTLRIVSFDHARNYPVIATVAVGKSEALGDWRSNAVILTAIVLALSSVIALAGHFLIRSVQLRIEAEAGVRQARDALSAANEKLAHMARDDGLTGIPNRRYFDMRLEKVFAQAQRNQRPMAIVMIDVDEFKKFNDLYGHLAGDECLKRVARALGSAVRRPEDLLARYGGEEMVLLLPETGAAGALCVAETARSAVAGMQITHPGTKLGVVSVSLGVAAWTPAAADLASGMLNAADVALYQAKAAGRNRIQLHGA